MNFANLSRVIAVIGPLLDQGPLGSTSAPQMASRPVLDASRVRRRKLHASSHAAREPQEVGRRAGFPRDRAAVRHACSTVPGLRPSGTRGAWRRRPRPLSPDPHASRGSTSVHLASDLPVVLKNQWRAISNMIDDARPVRAAAADRRAATLLPPRRSLLRRRRTRRDHQRGDSTVNHLSREAARLPPTRTGR